MPLYEYRCRVCGKESEILVTRASTAEAPSCPQCGAASMDKLMSASRHLSSGSSKSASPPPCAHNCAAGRRFS